MKPALQLAILMFAATSSAQPLAQGGGSPQVTPMSLEDALTIASEERQGRDRAGGRPVPPGEAGAQRAISARRAGVATPPPCRSSACSRMPAARAKTPASRICRLDGRTSGAWACCSRRRSTRAAASRRSSELPQPDRRSVRGSSVGPRNSRARRDPRAYYDVVLSDRLVTIAEAALAQADAAYQQTTSRIRRARSRNSACARWNATISGQILIRRKSDRDLAYLRLKQLLELPASTTLQLTAALDGLTLPIPDRFDAGRPCREGGYENQPETLLRAPVRQAENGIRASDAAVRLGAPRA